MNCNFAHDPLQKGGIIFHLVNHFQLQHDPVESPLKGRVGIIADVEVRMVPNSFLKALYILSNDLHRVKLTI